MVREDTAVGETGSAIMFADITGSTRLYEQLGDDEARARVAECLELAAGQVAEHHGRVVKTIGDEVLCVFREVSDAVAAACGIHQLLEGTGAIPDGAGGKLTMRIGINYGPALVQDDDVFGDAVNVAARMVAVAKAKQVTMPRATRQLLPPVLQAYTRYVDLAPIKGKREPMEVYDYLCHPDDATVLAEITQHERRPEVSSARFQYREGHVEVGTERPTAVFGREYDCDLVVQDKTASRYHMKVEVRRGRVFVMDQSTNGTYILPDHGERSFLRREEAEITGTGRLSLGLSFRKHPDEVIHYQVGADSPA
jgi:class 3 adenylate cyclase